MNQTIHMKHPNWGTTEVTDPEEIEALENSWWERVPQEECERDDSPELPPVA